MITAAAVIGMILFWLVLWIGVHVVIVMRKGMCDCKTEKLPFYKRNHVTETGLWWDAIFWAIYICFYVFIVGTPALYQIFSIIFFVLACAAIYYHRKLNKKRTLSKILGRVKVNEHGRLVITQN